MASTDTGIREYNSGDLAAIRRCIVELELRVNVLSGNETAESLYRRFGSTPYLETLTKRLDA